MSRTRVAPNKSQACLGRGSASNVYRYVTAHKGICRLALQASMAELVGTIAARPVLDSHSLLERLHYHVICSIASKTLLKLLHLGGS